MTTEAEKIIIELHAYESLHTINIIFFNITLLCKQYKSFVTPGSDYAEQSNA